MPALNRPESFGRAGADRFINMKKNGQVTQTIQDRIQERLAARGPEGKPLSLLTGQETLAELRNMIVELSREGPTGLENPGCPFRMMSGLTYASLTNLVNHMPREACVDLFEMELNCRSKANTPANGCERRKTWSRRKTEQS